ncbi:MAG TPA: Uma2 family endonuclease [Dehalococcoidia bacterium]|nr:Uma2 family endonuclease [Dehalococcoidia bacterium]
MVAHAATYKFTVDEYNRLAEIGFFRDARVELIEGDIVNMAPIGSRHYNTVNRLTTLFSPLAAARRAILHVQNPVVISPRSKPQPDVTLLKFREDFYRDREPGPEDVILLVEVADSSSSYEQLTKMPLYARAGVPECWLVDIPHSEIHVFTAPSPDGYKSVATFAGADAIAPAAFPEIRARVEEIIG